MALARYFDGTKWQPVISPPGPHGALGAAGATGPAGVDGAWSSPHPGQSWHMDYPTGVNLPVGAWTMYVSAAFPASVAGIYLMTYDATIRCLASSWGYISCNYTAPASVEAGFPNGAPVWNSQGTVQSFHVGFASTVWLPVGDTTILAYANCQAGWAELWESVVTMNLVVPSA